MNTDKNEISNGTGSTSFGCARIVISPEGEIRPVLRAVRSGYANSQGTFQVVHQGDLIFTCRTSANPKNGGDQDEVACWDGGQERPLAVMKQVDAWRWLRSLPRGGAIEEWLAGGYKCGRYSNFLPAGWGWDGEMTLADAAKERRIRRFFAGLPAETVDNIYRSARRSPGRSLPTNWSEAGDMPPTLDFPAESWDGALVDVDKSTSWVLWHRDGRVEHVTRAPTEGRWGSNYAHSSRGSYSGDEPEMPETVARAVRLQWGAHGLHHSHGIAWTLYATSAKMQEAVA